jgi:hypothetical protein
LCLLITVLCLLTLLAFPVSADVPVYRGEPSGEFLRTWLLCGPFPLKDLDDSAPIVVHLPGFETDFLKDHGGETDPRIKEGRTVTFDGGSNKWFTYTTDDFAIDLDEAISPDMFLVGYGYCEIESPEDRVCVLALGSNDGCRVWLNGEQVWDHPEARGIAADDDLVAVTLRKGRNKLLLKVEERGNVWGFCVRFLPFEAEKFADSSPLFRVVTGEDGTAVLRFLQPVSVAKLIVKRARIEVVSVDEPERVLWSEDWSKEREMHVGPEPDQYGKYLLRVRTVLMDGSEWTQTYHFAAGKRTEHVLFDKGRTDYAIVVAEDASESEKWAANELQHWLREVSGADFPVRSDAGTPGGHEIVVGFNRRTRALLGPAVAAPDDGDESFTYRNIGPSIVIWGGKQRGTMYGVMTFLERELGCRWYTPRVSVVPKKDRYAFDYLRHSDSPGIRVRNDFYYEAFEPIWAARQKVNGSMNYREQPGGVEGYWAVHTFYHLVRPSEFFAEHPEYYSLINGKRVHARTQLCLTNPDVVRIATERLKQVMRDNPGNLIYSVSQNDWRNPCQCDKCAAIVEREGSESGPIIWFVNRVAEGIEDEFPDKFVGTLAYSYTRKPCKTLRPRHNVVVRLCSIECCFAHDFLSCPENESFVSDLLGWAAIAPHLYIWDYVVNFDHYTMPYPNFRVLQPNIRTFRDNKALGIMEQAAYQSRGGEFAELRAYVIAKLLWNPECDVEQVINDFMYGYYGRSGQHVRRYFDLLHGRLTPETHIHLGLRPDDPLFSDEFVREAEAILDEAEAVADTEEVRHRVEMARLPIMYLKCMRTPLEAKFDGTYSRFCEIVDREGITHYAERGEPHRRGFHKKVEAAK